MRFSGTIFYETHPLMLQKQKLWRFDDVERLLVC